MDLSDLYNPRYRLADRNWGFYILWIARPPHLRLVNSLKVGTHAQALKREPSRQKPFRRVRYGVNEIVAPLFGQSQGPAQAGADVQL